MRLLVSPACHAWRSCPDCSHNQPERITLRVCVLVCDLTEQLKLG